MRPGVQLTSTGLDKVLEVSATIILIVLWVIAVYAFVKMPDTIPTHYNASGEVDDYGSKATILLLPAIATILFAGLTVVNRYPHLFNYPTEITEANAERQYTLVTRMIRFVKLAMMLTFTEITAATYFITEGSMKGLGMWIIPFELSIIAIPIGIVFMQSRKRKEV